MKNIFDKVFPSDATKVNEATIEQFLANNDCLDIVISNFRLDVSSVTRTVISAI